MKIHFLLARFAFLTLACLVIAACGGVEITSPDATRKNLSTNFDLIVEHSGCGVPKPGIKAWLDKGTESEKEISSAFVFDGSHKWKAMDYPLPLGTHTLEVDPDVDWGKSLECYGHKADIKREFVVHESTCIKGKVYQKSIGSPPGPYPGGFVKITLVDSGEIVASGSTDDSSSFCFDGIPVGHIVNVSFWGANDPQLLNYDAGITPHSCANQDCPDICDDNPACEGGCFIAKIPPED